MLRHYFLLGVHIIEGTIQACKRRAYPYGPNQERIQICDSNEVYAKQAQATVQHDLTQRYDLSPADSSQNYGDTDAVDDDQDTDAMDVETGDENPIVTIVEVKNADCLDEALRLKELGLNPVVLNMASAKRPGGGYENGAGAQEENIFRRTNLAFVLADIEGLDPKRRWGYPLPEFSSVYTPKAFILRSSEQTGYAFLPAPVEMAFVAVAAYANPATNTKRDGTIWLTQKMAEKTDRKIRGLLYVSRALLCTHTPSCLLIWISRWTALSHGHDSIVLSALGCGAYKNPPKHIAQIFRKVLQDTAFKNKFKHVVFAIFDDHNARKSHNPEGNVQPFVDVFQDWMAKGASHSGGKASSSSSNNSPPSKSQASSSSSSM
jgi:uncharacterized protein (TIGR02452 family)